MLLTHPTVVIAKIFQQSGENKMKQHKIKTVVVVGGGNAGWLTAGRIAAHHKANQADGIKVVLVESANIATVGVGDFLTT